MQKLWEQHTLFGPLLGGLPSLLPVCSALASARGSDMHSWIPRLAAEPVNQQLAGWRGGSMRSGGTLLGDLWDGGGIEGLCKLRGLPSGPADSPAAHGRREGWGLPDCRRRRAVVPLHGVRHSCLQRYWRVMHHQDFGYIWSAPQAWDRGGWWGWKDSWEQRRSRKSSSSFPAHYQHQGVAITGTFTDKS